MNDTLAQEAGAGVLTHPEPRGDTSHVRSRSHRGRPATPRGAGAAWICHNMESSPRPVRPVSPVAAYIGGKRHLAALIVERIQAVPHDLYAEPFVGMGGVFLRRSAAPAAEVINDLSRDVSGLFRVLQRHYQAFLDMLRWQLTSRADFDRLTAVDPDTLTDLERAARFLYLQRLSFGGKVTGRTFGVSSLSPARFDLGKLVPLLEAVHERLDGVVIECLPWAELLDRYDRPGALFYFDPPYMGSEHYYGRTLFKPADHWAVARRLRQLKASWMLSINDCTDARAIYAGFALEELETTYHAGGGDRTAQVRELLLSSPGLLDHTTGSRLL